MTKEQLQEFLSERNITDKEFVGYVLLTKAILEEMNEVEEQEQLCS